MRAPLVEARQAPRPNRETPHAELLKELARLMRKNTRRQAMGQKQERKTKEQAQGAGWSLYDGARYLISNTRRVSYDPRMIVHGDSVESVLAAYVQANVLSIGDPVGGSVDNLHDNIEAVGAVLLNERGEYSGIALPVVESEAHTTRIIRVGSDHWRHVLITATEKQVAVALGRCVPTAAEQAPTERRLDSTSPLFLRHMFLDDICDLGGSPPEDAVNGFRAFLQRLAGINVRTRSILSHHDYVWHRGDEDALKDAGSEETIAHFNAILESSIASQRRSLTNIERTTSIIPLSYYNDTSKKGHQIALLVHEQPGRTIVALSDTGATALTHIFTKGRHIREDTAIVAMGYTSELGIGRGIRDFGLSIMGAIRNEDMLRIVRRLILEKCGVEFVDRTRLDGSDEPSGAARTGDLHLAVRFLSSGKNRIVSHSQRGGTCTFYSTLWLLGIADALLERPDVADHILLGKKADSERNAYILARICHIDKEMKRTALGSLTSLRHARTAELVACDYAGCEWLNTEWLRDKLTESSQKASITDVHLDTSCVVKKVPNAPPLLRRKEGFTLGELAEWTRVHGYAGGPDPKLSNVRAAAYATFVYMARDILIKPMLDRAMTEDDDMHILALSRYLSFLRMPSAADAPRALRVEADAHTTDTIIGMAMRCVRYIARIVKNNPAHIRPAQTDSSLVVLPTTFQTSLPWVAAEYYALQEETKAIAHLLFDSETIDSMSRIDTADKQPSEVRLISTNEFHRDLIKSKKQSIRDDKALLARHRAEIAALGDAVEQQSEIAVVSSRIEKTRDYVEHTTSLELPRAHIKALRYIQCNRDISVLNVAVALLVHEDACVKSSLFETFILGVEEDGLTRFCASSSRDASKLPSSNTSTLYEERTLTPILNTRFGLLREQPSTLPPHADMVQNMEYMFDATKDCSSKKRRAHKKENEPLCLKLSYPLCNAHLDVASLVNWADHINAGVASCVHDDRSLEYVIRRYTTPISSNGPVFTDGSIAKLRTLLERAGRGASDTTLQMVAHIQRLIDRSVETRLGVPTSAIEALLVRAYMAIAAHTGQMELVMRVNFALATSTETHPDSSWALTPIRADMSDTEVFFYAADGTKTTKKFVFWAEGGRVAKVHDRFVSAGVRFDHWLESDGSSSIVTHNGVRVTSSASQEVVVTGVGSTAHTLFLTGGHCAWWDTTYGAAVLPIGVDGVERLIVVPGDRTRCTRSTDFPTSIAPKYPAELSVLAAYIDSLPKYAFVVELDTVGLLPSLSTGTDELVLLFVAYAYAGSALGTRLMPRVAARSIHDDREVPVPGSGSAIAHDAIRLVVRGAVCPLGCYSALALLPLESADVSRSVASDLRCEPDEAQSALVARITSCSVYDKLARADLDRRARFCFWVQYGEPERLLAHAKATQKETDGERSGELRRLQFHTDEWMTTLSATTGVLVREEQRARIALITRSERAWSVVQMGMGFGKSSVIVPLLVARYLCLPYIRIVFVTQPPHLVPQAARTVGALIAAHPYVGTDAVRTANAGDFRRHIVKHDETYPKSKFFDPARLASMKGYKIVVVLSTADMQCLVRDHCSIYGASDHIAHIADEVDSESDPMRCEVIIEGPVTTAHYHPEVAKEQNVGAYYDAVCALGIRSDNPQRQEREIAEKIRRLDRMCPSGTVKAGTRLKAVFDAVRQNMVHRTHFGLSHVESKIPAVPFEYAGTPSTTKDFADYDVLFSVTATSVNAKERPCDLDRLRQHITGKFGRSARRILDVLDRNPIERRRYYLTHIAMPGMRASTTETMVSFVDGMGAAQTFIGFSGTMGTTVEAPVSTGDPSKGAISYESREDPRYNKRDSYAVDLHDDEKSNGLVKALVTNATVLYVDPQPPGTTRAKAAIAKIAGHMKTHEQHVCIVDGNGEFGAFDDDLEKLKEAWPHVQHIGTDGLVARSATEAAPRVVRYYSHRNSRGVDTDMPIDTVGYTTMCKRTSILSDIAQAVFRLRRLKADGPSQKIALVVVSEADGAQADGSIVPDGAALFDILTANQRAHVLSAARTKEMQMRHAAKLKIEGGDSFERSVVYTDLPPEQHKATKISRKQQVHVSQAENQSQNQGYEDKTLRRQESEQCYERTKLQMEGPLTLLNATTVTSISPSLAITNIALSPMITIRELNDPKAAIRRAFAASKRGALVVLTIVEAWAKYLAEDAQGPYAYYTDDGAFILGDSEARESTKHGAVLLGRYMCDDALSIEEEMLLLVYIRGRYATPEEQESFRSVIACLVHSGFVSEKTELLNGLVSAHADAVIKSLSAQSIADKMASDPVLNRVFFQIFQAALSTTSITQT